MNIVWLEADSLIVPLPRPCFPHHWTEYPYTTAQDTASRIADAEVVILNKVKLGADELAHAPKLKLVAITATGMDNVDVKACRARGIEVKNVVNYGPQSVAEHAFACLLQLVRRVPEWQAKVQSEHWISPTKATPQTAPFWIEWPAIGQNARDGRLPCHETNNPNA